MILTASNLLKSIFSSGHSKSTPPLSVGDHAYVKGKPEDRGPCPGLNALANQGFIARDGRDLTLAQIEQALMQHLHMTKLLATSLTNALKPLVRKDGTFDLVDTRRHNMIEHDNSFTRHDEWQGDNYTFQPDMFQAMLDDAGGGALTLRTLAKSFNRRDKESKAAGAPKLSLKLWFVRLLNVAGAMNTTMLPGGKLSKDVAEQGML